MYAIGTVGEGLWIYKETKGINGCLFMNQLHHWRNFSTCLNKSTFKPHRQNWLEGITVMTQITETVRSSVEYTWSNIVLSLFSLLSVQVMLTSLPSLACRSQCYWSASLLCQCICGMPMAQSIFYHLVEGNNDPNWRSSSGNSGANSSEQPLSSPIPGSWKQ